MKTYHLAIPLLLVVLALPVHAQSWQWVQTYGYNSGCEERGTGIGADEHGNMYVKEETICVITGPGSTVEGSDHLFKYDSLGNLIWKVKCIQGAIATDKHGNTYIAGFFQICKIDSSGNILWTIDIPNRYFTKVALHPQGGIISAGQIPFISCSSVIYRLDENGNILWNKVGDYHCPYSMTVDKNGKSYLLMKDRIGIYDNNGDTINQISVPYAEYTHILIDNDLSFYTLSRLHSYPNNTITINKYNGGNNMLEWTKNLTAKHGGVGGAHFNESNNLVLAGSFWDAMTYGNIAYTLPKSMFLMEINNYGTLKWIKNNPSNEQKTANDLVIVNNNVIITGRIQGPHSFDQIPVIADDDMCDMFVAKLTMPELSTSVSEENKLDAAYLNIYPSPNNGVFFAETVSGTGTKLNIFNALGQEVYTDEIRSAQDSKLQIDISSHPKGLYILKCETEKGTFTKKIVLQ